MSKPWQFDALCKVCHFTKQGKLKIKVKFLYTLLDPKKQKRTDVKNTILHKLLSFHKFIIQLKRLCHAIVEEWQTNQSWQVFMTEWDVYYYYSTKKRNEIRAGRHDNKLLPT